MHAKRSPLTCLPSHPHDSKRRRVFNESDEKTTEHIASSCLDTPTFSQGQTKPIYMNLEFISRSPPKPSPMKLFKILTHTGGIVEVPITPARRPTVNPEIIVDSAQVQAMSSRINPTINPNVASTINDILPLPVIPQAPRASDPVPVSPSKTPVELHGPPAPGPSRRPKPCSPKASSLPDNVAKTPTRLPSLFAPTVSSLAKTKPHVSPMRLRSRPQLKSKLGIKDRTPANKLALQRTIRHASLGKEKVKGALLPSVKPSEILANAAGKPPKEAKQTILKGFFSQRCNVSKQPPLSSPSKPTPLVALSTALKKLEVSAPLPLSRFSVNTGLVESLTVAPTQCIFNQDTLNVVKSGPVADSRPTVTPKAQLPLRFLSNPDTNWKMNLPSREFSVIQNSFISVTRPSSVELAIQLHDGSISQKSSEAVDVATRLDTVAGEHKENKHPLEFFVPLSNESTKLQALAQISPSRRASQASLALSQSLSAPNKSQIFSQVRSVTASHLQLNARSPVKTRGKTKSNTPAAEFVSQPTGKRLNARMPGSLDVLRDCVIFVDVKTEEGEDAAPLFVDMLRGLGARILSKPGKSCTHLVFKAGLPSTVVKYKLFPQPKPLVVSIGWVVECVEKRSHVEETKFSVNLDDFDVTGGLLRRRSVTMQPKQIQALVLGQLDPTDLNDSGANGDASFTSEGFSAVAHPSPPQRIVVADNLPPLERARQRSQRFCRKN